MITKTALSFKNIGGTISGLGKAMFTDKDSGEVSAQALNYGLKSTGQLSMLALGTGMALKAGINKIRNNITKNALIEDLLLTDPILKNADKQKVMSYYATICNIAPQIATDKNVVRFLLQRFIEVGFDFNTIRDLANTNNIIDKTKESRLGSFLR